MSRVGGPQESIFKSCVYFKMHNCIIFSTYFEANFENKQKSEEKRVKIRFFALFFNSFLFLKTVGGPQAACLRTLV